MIVGEKDDGETANISSPPGCYGNDAREVYRRVLIFNLGDRVLGNSMTRTSQEGRVRRDESVILLFSKPALLNF